MEYSVFIYPIKLWISMYMQYIYTLYIHVCACTLYIIIMCIFFIYFIFIFLLLGAQTSSQVQYSQDPTLISRWGEEGPVAAARLSVRRGQLVGTLVVQVSNVF